MEKNRNYILFGAPSQVDMPLLKVVVSSTRNSTETVAALERDLDGHSPSSSTHDVNQELPDHSQLANEPSQVVATCFHYQSGLRIAPIF